MMPLHGLIALVIATAFLIWVNEKAGNPAQKFGKFIAWLAIIVSAVMLIGQFAMHAKMCMSGQCMRMMDKDHGMGMMHNMPGMPEMPETK